MNYPGSGNHACDGRIIEVKMVVLHYPKEFLLEYCLHLNNVKLGQALRRRFKVWV